MSATAKDALYVLGGLAVIGFFIVRERSEEFSSSSDQRRFRTISRSHTQECECTDQLELPRLTIS